MPRLTQAQKDELGPQCVELYAEGNGDSAIGRLLGINRATVKKLRDDEYAKRAETRDNDIEQHMAVYTAIQRHAWAAFKNTDERSLNKAGLLNTIKSAEDSKVKLTGAEAPSNSNVNMTVRGGVPEDELELLDALEAYKRDASAVAAP